MCHDINRYNMGWISAKSGPDLVSWYDFPKKWFSSAYVAVSKNSGIPKIWMGLSCKKNLFKNGWFGGKTGYFRPKHPRHQSGCRHSHMELVLDEVVVATGPCLSNGPTGWLSKIKISQFDKVWGILWDLGGLRGERGSKDFADRKCNFQVKCKLTCCDRLMTSWWTCGLGKRFL